MTRDGLPEHRARQLSSQKIALLYNLAFLAFVAHVFKESIES